MANYIIVGGDNKEYGPVSEAEVRQWIAEGRLNGQSRVRAEGGMEFLPLTQFPELADALPPDAPATIAPLAHAGDFADRDYELDIGDCLTRGWGLLKDHFGVIFGSFIILMLVQMACGGVLGMVSVPLNSVFQSSPAWVKVLFDYVSGAAFSLVLGPLMGGLFLVYLKTIRGEPTGIGELFAGFQQAFLQLFLGSLMVSLVVRGCMLPFMYVIHAKMAPLLEQMQHMQNDPSALQGLLPQIMSALAGGLPVLCICLVPVTFFSVCWMFTLPLIIDQQMTFDVAMKTSWRMVIKHWWMLLGLTIVTGLISSLGLLACCIGILFTAPIAVGATLYAYETIFGAKKISHAKARNVAMLNLLATPGLGSLAAGRWLAGAGQLFVFMAGFVFFCGWMFNNLHQYYGLMYSDAPPPPNLGWNQMAWASVVLCGGAWLWSLVTSLSLMREAAAVPVADLKLFGAGLVKLEEEQISSSLAALPLWQRQEQVITRTYEFKDFPEAMKFVNAVAAFAEQAQHHPDLDVRWNKVTLAFTTHDAGGLTNKDFALARECDELAQAKPPELRPAS